MKTTHIISLVVAALFVFAGLKYFDAKKTEVSDVDNIQAKEVCTLKPAFDPEFMWWPGKTSVAGGYPWVTGFKGALDQISWVSMDPSIVEIIPPNTGDGSKIVKRGGKEGVTTVVITDNFVGKDCNVSFN